MATDFQRAHKVAMRSLDRVQPPVMTVRLSTLGIVAVAMFVACLVAGWAYQDRVTYPDRTLAKRYVNSVGFTYASRPPPHIE